MSARRSSGIEELRLNSGLVRFCVLADLAVNCAPADGPTVAAPAFFVRLLDEPELELVLVLVLVDQPTGVGDGTNSSLD